MNRQRLEAIRSRLEQIAEDNGGRITPDAVVRDAEDASSPLHNQFEWDDTEAAKKWRLEQARQLIRSVKVDIQTEEKVVSTVRYVRDPSAGDSQGYIETARLRDDRTLAVEALQSEIRAANAMVARARSLAEALGLEAEIRMVAESIERLEASFSEAA